MASPASSKRTALMASRPSEILSSSQFSPINSYKELSDHSYKLCGVSTLLNTHNNKSEQRIILFSEDRGFCCAYTEDATSHLEPIKCISPLPLKFNAAPICQMMQDEYQRWLLIARDNTFGVYRCQWNQQTYPSEAFCTVDTPKEGKLNGRICAICMLNPRTGLAVFFTLETPSIFSKTKHISLFAYLVNCLECQLLSSVIITTFEDESLTEEAIAAALLTCGVASASADSFDILVALLHPLDNRGYYSFVSVEQSTDTLSVRYELLPIEASCGMKDRKCEHLEILPNSGVVPSCSISLPYILNPLLLVHWQGGVFEFFSVVADSPHVLRSKYLYRPTRNTAMKDDAEMELCWLCKDYALEYYYQEQEHLLLCIIRNIHLGNIVYSNCEITAPSKPQKLIALLDAPLVTSAIPEKEVLAFSLFCLGESSVYSFRVKLPRIALSQLVGRGRGDIRGDETKHINMQLIQIGNLNDQESKLYAQLMSAIFGRSKNEITKLLKQNDEDTKNHIEGFLIKLLEHGIVPLQEAMIRFVMRYKLLHVAKACLSHPSIPEHLAVLLILWNPELVYLAVTLLDSTRSLLVGAFREHSTIEQLCNLMLLLLNWAEGELMVDKDSNKSVPIAEILEFIAVLIDSKFLELSISTDDEFLNLLARLGRFVTQYSEDSKSIQKLHGRLYGILKAPVSMWAIPNEVSLLELSYIDL